MAFNTNTRNQKITQSDDLYKELLLTTSEILLIDSLIDEALNELIAESLQTDEKQDSLNEDDE